MVRAYFELIDCQGKDRGRDFVAVDMRNKLLLLGYLTLFFVIVSNYDLYRENVVVVVLAASAILIGGLVTWLISIRGSAGD